MTDILRTEDDCGIKTMRDKKKRKRNSDRREREMEKRSCSARGRKWDWTGEITREESERPRRQHIRHTQDQSAAEPVTVSVQRVTPAPRSNPIPNSRVGRRDIWKP